MAAWQDYVDTSLVGTGNVDKALICDATNPSPWAQTPGFNPDAREIQAIIDSFDDKTEPKKVISEGIKINGEKYMTIDADHEQLKAKKGKEGIVAVKSNRALIIAHHPAEIQTTVAFSTAAALQAYLKENGF